MSTFSPAAMELGGKPAACTLICSDYTTLSDEEVSHSDCLEIAVPLGEKGTYFFHIYSTYLPHSAEQSSTLNTVKWKE